MLNEILPLRTLRGLDKPSNVGATKNKVEQKYSTIVDKLRLCLREKVGDINSGKQRQTLL